MFPIDYGNIYEPNLSIDKFSIEEGARFVPFEN